MYDHWREDLYLILQTVDQDRSGKITAAELRQALFNNNWSQFNPETCRLMIGMFDKDQWVAILENNIDINTQNTIIITKEGGVVSILA